MLIENELIETDTYIRIMRTNNVVIPSNDENKDVIPSEDNSKDDNKGFESNIVD
jgi:hypothetical protein